MWPVVMDFQFVEISKVAHFYKSIQYCISRIALPIQIQMLESYAFGVWCYIAKLDEVFWGIVWRAYLNTS